MSSGQPRSGPGVGLEAGAGNEGPVDLVLWTLADHGGTVGRADVLPQEEGDSQRYKTREPAVRSPGGAEDCGLRLVCARPFPEVRWGWGVVPGVRLWHSV